jgi:hypothetical protein
VQVSQPAAASVDMNVAVGTLHRQITKNRRRDRLRSMAEELASRNFLTRVKKFASINDIISLTTSRDSCFDSQDQSSLRPAYCGWSTVFLIPSDTISCEIGFRIPFREVSKPLLAARAKTIEGFLPQLEAPVIV